MSGLNPAIPTASMPTVPAAPAPAPAASTPGFLTPAAPAAAPVAPPPAAPTAVPAPAPAAPAIGTDQLALSQGAAPSADIGALRRTIFGGSQIDATMALAQLEGLAGANRAEVVTTLMSVANGGSEINALSAIDILSRLQAPEATELLQRLATGGSSPAIRNAARGATPAPAAPAVASTPAAPGPNTPLVTAPGATTAATPAQPAAAAPDSYSLLADLLDAKKAPMAVVQLSKMTDEQMLPVVQRALRDFQLSPEVLEMVTTMMGKRVKNPAVAQVVAQVLAKPARQYPRATSKAALALLSTKSPTFLNGILRYIAQRESDNVPVKRVLVDTIAKNPQLLNQPQTAVVLGSVLHEQESTELAMAASHALAGIKSAAARDALAASPLFFGENPDHVMRAMIDLNQQPAPYPPKATAQLQRLAKSKNAQIAKLAGEMLKKSGVK